MPAPTNPQDITVAGGPAQPGTKAGQAPYSQRLDNLERTVTQINEILNQQQAKSTAPSGWWTDTKISGRMFYDLTYIEHKRSGVRQDSSGPGFDIKRFYLGIDHRFDDTFSANITTDFLYDSTAGATQLFIKKAYLDMNLAPEIDVRFGSTDLPWVPFVEDIYGYRYVEAILIDRTKFGTSADWGVHAKGKLANGLIHYAVAAVNGAGYKHPFTGAHTNVMDFEGRVDLDWNNFILAVGGYVGKLGKDVDSVATPHTANRFDAIAAYKTEQVALGVEYFIANDWNNVTSVTSDQAEGVSVFGSYKFAPMWAVFTRYDYMEPNQDTNSSLNDNYFNVGITYSPAKIVDFSLAYKHEWADHGNLSTANGTIGGLTTMTDGTYDEAGVWARFRW
ncbi:MAG: hypothetical protein WCF16_01760 [Alphaproteobacteria bacterium]